MKKKLRERHKHTDGNFLTFAKKRQLHTLLYFAKDDARTSILEKIEPNLIKKFMDDFVLALKEENTLKKVLQERFKHRKNKNNLIALTKEKRLHAHCLFKEEGVTIELIEQILVKRFVDNWTVMLEELGGDRFNLKEINIMTIRKIICGRQMLNYIENEIAEKIQFVLRNRLTTKDSDHFKKVYDDFSKAVISKILFF